MNRIHRWLCRSASWRKGGRRLSCLGSEPCGPGAEVLEVGPGPRLTTDILRPRIPHLTALEIDPALADALARMRGSNVTVIRGDATVMPFGDAQFTGAICCHAPPCPLDLQNRAAARGFRVVEARQRVRGCGQPDELFCAPHSSRTPWSCQSPKPCKLAWRPRVLKKSALKLTHKGSFLH